MYKKLTAALVCCLLLTACSGHPAPSSDTTEPTATTGTTTAASASTTAAATTAALAPINDLGDFQALYDTALERVTAMRFCDVRVDGSDCKDTDGYRYCRVNEDAYSTMAELRAYLGECFTEEFIDRELLPADQILWREFDGALYMLEFGRGSNLLYAGHVLELTSLNDREICWTAHCYYAKNADDAPDEPFYETPADAARYDVEDKPLTLQNTADGWRFSQFPVYY